ncbi:WD40/YVTN/BNR-like repeat-containing protein [Acidobacteriota bacterium]
MNRIIRLISSNLIYKAMLVLFIGVLALPALAGFNDSQIKVENTDPALRLKWFEQHRAMKAASPFKDLEWRFVGPDTLSGRCTDIAVPKGSRDTIYIASATGGVWKTTNYGVTWKPIMDDAPSISIGDVTVAPSNRDIVWIGTGESNIYRGSVAGIGVYKSIDAGATWQHMGLADTNTISRIAIHPENPDIVYVAATGHEWTHNEERGVFKTKDGGQSWEKVHYINDHTGAIDLVMDPSDPEILYVAMWNRTRLRWSDPRPGPGDGIFKTTDGGKTWNQKTNGLPDFKLTGRIGMDICHSNPNVLYALIDNHNPGREPKKGERDPYGRLRDGPVAKGAEVYRTGDKGETWHKVSPSNQFMESFAGTYGWGFTQMRVDPGDEDTIYILGVQLAKSIDGGKSFKTINYPGLHPDHHGLWINPEDSNYIVDANDGGIAVSYDGGKSWRAFLKDDDHTYIFGSLLGETGKDESERFIPVIQFYNLAYDMAKPFRVYGSIQDHGTYRGSIAHTQSYQKKGYYRVTGWEFVPGGEGTHIAVDPADPNTIYASTFYGRLIRGEFKDNDWKVKNILPKVEEGEPPLRGQWLSPTIISPHNPHVIYHGMQYLFRSMDKGETWVKISPDLSYDDPNKKGKLPFAIPYGCLVALSESPFKFGLIYAGTDDGRVHITKNSGGDWTDITKGLPYNKHVSRIVASKYDEGTVYLTLNGRRDDDFVDYIYKSTDYGQTWVDISGNIPCGPVNVIREDPKKENILYLGTDLGVYLTLDGGSTWHSLSSNLPTCFVWDLIIHPRDNVLVIATYGRGMWAIDKVSKIQKQVE